MSSCQTALLLSSPILDLYTTRQPSLELRKAVGKWSDPDPDRMSSYPVFTSSRSLFFVNVVRRSSSGRKLRRSSFGISGLNMAPFFPKAAKDRMRTRSFATSSIPGSAMSGAHYHGPQSTLRKRLLSSRARGVQTCAHPQTSTPR
jgi:hypothetical protein